MPAINPQILIWARETAGLSRGEAAAKLQLAGGETRVAEFETGDRAPSNALLNKMVKAYRRPLLAFYLASPPSRGEIGEDFRNLPQRDTADEPLVSALLRNVKARQSLVRTVLEEERQDSLDPLPFVNSMRPGDGVHAVLASIQQVLQIDRAEFRSQGTHDAAFGYIRTKAEAAGIFVLLIGNLGTHHTNLEVSAFRGFALADPVAPFVVINDQDARSAWSFTLLHEIAHLWIGASGISGAYGESQIERFCNEVASEFLVTSTEIEEFGALDDLSEDAIAEQIGQFAGERLVSMSMVAYRLYRVQKVDFPQWERISERFRVEWRASREEARARTRASTSGPNYYVVRRHRLGSALLKLVDRTVSTGLLSPTRAGTVLDVKPRSVGPLLSAIHGRAA